MYEIPIDDTLTLRVLLPPHAPELFALIDRNRAHLTRWLPWVELTREVADSEDFIRSMLTVFGTGRNALGIWHHDRLVGVVGYNRWDEREGVCEIGYWLSEDAQGHGVITRATARLTTHALDERGLHRVEIHTAAGNLASQRVAERLGFTREGTHRQAITLYGERHDRVVFARLASDPNPRPYGHPLR